MRFADDFVGRFQFWGDAQNFQRQLRERFAQFNLEPAEEKTRLLFFGRFAAVERRKHGQRPETFETARLRKGLLLQGSSPPSLAFRFSVHTGVEGRVGQHFGRGRPTESYTANVLNGRV